MEHTYEVKVAQLFEGGTHKPVGFGLFVHRDGFSYTGAFHQTPHRSFKTAQAAQQAYDAAEIFPYTELEKDYSEFWPLLRWTGPMPDKVRQKEAEYQARRLEQEAAVRA